MVWEACIVWMSWMGGQTDDRSWAVLVVGSQQ